MSIASLIREIGRGRDHARDLSREQAQELMGQIFDGTVSDLELGAFCVAMRIKGETAQELAGFIDAAQSRTQRLRAQAPCIVIPSYNGARKLPLMTPLLAGLLAQQGCSVLIHGAQTEDTRIACESVMRALNWPVLQTLRPIAASEVVFVPTHLLSPGLQRLLDVRRTIGLRNAGHSLVKLLLPLMQPGLLISSYTHPEYATSMSQALTLTETAALLLRGTEGESVADPRRQPQIDLVMQGQVKTVCETQVGPLSTVPAMPEQIDAHATARFIEEALDTPSMVPASIQKQAALAAQWARKIQS